MRLTERAFACFLLAALAAPALALAQGSGVKGEDPHRVRIGVLRQFVRTELAREAAKYVKSFDVHQIPVELERERYIFSTLFAKGLHEEADNFKFTPSPVRCMANGKRKCATAEQGRREHEVPVCIDVERCAEEYSYKVYDDETAKKFLVATVLHEKAHQYDFPDEDADLVSGYVRRTVSLGPVAPSQTTPVAWSALSSVTTAAQLERELALEEEKLRWRNLTSSVRRILEECKDASCQLAKSEAMLPDAIHSLLETSCSWPVIWRKTGAAATGELFTGAGSLIFTKKFWSLESWQKLAYETVGKLGPQDYDPDSSGARELQRFHPELAYKCFEGALREIESRTQPRDVDELEKLEISVAQSACEAIGEDAYSEFHPVSQFAYSRDQCYARAAAALASLDHPSRLSKRRPHLWVLANGCSLGKPERLSGSARDDFSWPDVRIGTCYKRGFDFLLQPWPISLSEKQLRKHQIGLLLGSCQFTDERTFSVMPYSSKATCLQKGAALAGQDLNFAILASGCRYEAIATNSKAVARCFEEGLAFLLRWEAPATGPEVDRYTLGMMLGAFTAPEEPAIKERMVRSALRSGLVPPTFTALSRQCEQDSRPEPCLFWLKEEWRRVRR